MPQEMNILCCYSCKMYQVHIVKKVRKWQCKLCNEKQSVKQVYFQGSGKDCRLHVQRLNSLKTSEAFSAVASEPDGNNSYYNTSPNIPEMSGSDNITENKWTKYLESSRKEQSPDTENSFSEDICQADNRISGEKSLYDDENNTTCNFDMIMNDSNFEIEDVAEDREKDPSSTSCDKNRSIDQYNDLQDKSTKDHSNIIFNNDMIMNDSGSEIEDDAEDHEKDPSSMSCDKNRSIDQYDNLQDKSTKGYSNIIFNNDMIMNDSGPEIEDDVKNHEKNPSMNYDKNCSINRWGNLRDNNKSSKDCNVVIFEDSIFETYDKLDDPLDF